MNRVLILGYISATLIASGFHACAHGGGKPDRSFTGQHNDILYTSRHLNSDIADNAAMPWKATDAMKERVNFVLEWERRWDEARGGPVDVAELCRKYGVSRPTGYAWVKRFRDASHDVRAVEERSRRPHSNPQAISPEVEDWIVQARKAMPRRGPRKLRAILVERNPGIEWPSTSSIGNILKRRGLCRVRKLGQRAPPRTQPFAATTAPTTPVHRFQGQIPHAGRELVPRAHAARRGHALPAARRADARPERRQRREGPRLCIQEFGLPKAMRSDNGPPFASTGAGRLSRLSVWWLKLGIQLERIEPGKPQQNGRLERCHLTLEEAVTPSAENLVKQRRAIDEWRRDYNHVRPHQALGDVPPALVYRRSPRRYPRKLLKPDPPAWREACDVDRQGCIRWRRHKLFLTSALAARSSSWKGSARPPGRSASSTSSSACSTSGRSIAES